MESSRDVSLSQLYVCQHAQGNVVTNQSDHICYEYYLHDGLRFAKKSSGIPIVNAEERKSLYNCKLPRIKLPNEHKFKISEVFRYDTLEQALECLKTHPVAATLICYEGWDEPGVYVGSQENVLCEGLHWEVLVLTTCNYKMFSSLQH